MEDIEKWDSKKMVSEYDISKFIVKNNKKEIVYHIPNELNIDYDSNKKVLLNQYKEVEIEYKSDQDFHRVICSKFDREPIGLLGKSSFPESIWQNT